MCIRDSCTDVYFNLAVEEYLLKQTQGDYFVIWQSEDVYKRQILGFFGIWYVHRAIRRQKLQLIGLNDIDSVFPTVLSWLVATAATPVLSLIHISWLAAYCSGL